MEPSRPSSAAAAHDTASVPAAEGGATAQSSLPTSNPNDTSASVHDSTTAHPQPQHLLVLCGLIGSGKSTLALAIVRHLSNWVRCNQDMLGTRNAVAVLAWRSLVSGSNVIIDRTNVDVRQRRTWLQLGRDVLTQLPEGRQLIVSSLTMTTPFDECERRLRARRDHETLHDAQKAVEVLHRFCRTYTPPRVEEGYHCCVEIRPQDINVEATKEQVERVIRQIERSEKANGALPDNVRGYGWGRASAREAGGRGRGGRGGGGVGRSALRSSQPHME